MSEPQQVNKLTKAALLIKWPNYTFLIVLVVEEDRPETCQDGRIKRSHEKRGNEQKMGQATQTKLVKFYSFSGDFLLRGKQNKPNYNVMCCEGCLMVAVKPLRKSENTAQIMSLTSLDKRPRTCNLIGVFRLP